MNKIDVFTRDYVFLGGANLAARIRRHEAQGRSSATGIRRIYASYLASIGSQIRCEKDRGTGGGTIEHGIEKLVIPLAGI